MSFDPTIIIDNWDLFARGLATTLFLCGVALPAGFILGTCVAWVQLRGGRVAGAIALAYVEIIRNIPFLILVFLLFFALPFFGLRLGPFVTSIVALTAYASAYFAEILRGGIQSISKGQIEGGYALGLRYGLVFRKILLPQIIGYILPAATNLTISLIKESAVLSVITVSEMTYMAQNVIGKTFAPVEVFAFLALVYWALTAILAAFSSAMERRMQPYLNKR
jgi:His/Glu/Gln/Arg/opine family amino acid ABC transporter permease subunit